jgi:hypothetical protein
VSSVNFHLSATINKMSAAFKFASGIFFRLTPRKAVAKNGHEPLRPASTSTISPEFESNSHLVSAAECTSQSRLGSKASRRHTIAVCNSAQKSPTKGSPESITRHARSNTAPLTIFLVPDEVIEQKKDGPENANMGH